ncbi:MAG: zinc dependent phospholipase C family protein [Desulfovibrio sp.]
MQRATFTLIVAVFIAVLSPSEALAWGPGVHLALGNALLNTPQLLPDAIGGFLPLYRFSYLYGMLSPDIFIGKGCKYTPKHSHNWAMGQEMMRCSDSLHMKAFSLGYLSHLAADTIAHNYYVPNMLSLAPTRGKFSHVYVEMQADSLVDWCGFDARSLMEMRHRTADSTLQETLAKKGFSFRMKKNVFSRSMGLSGNVQVQRSLHVASRAVKGFVNTAYFEDMFELSLRMIRGVMHDMESHPALNLDPIGSTNLEVVKRMPALRRKLCRVLPCGSAFPLAAEVAALQKSTFDEVRFEQPAPISL